MPGELLEDWRSAVVSQTMGLVQYPTLRNICALLRKRGSKVMQVEVILLLITSILFLHRSLVDKRLVNMEQDVVQS